MKKIEPMYISFYEKCGIVYMSYNHPLFSLNGVTIRISDISVYVENDKINIHIQSETSRSLITCIEDRIRMTYPTLQPILRENYITIPYNQVTSKFVGHSHTEGYITIKHLRDTRDKKYRAIIHFHLK